MTTTPIAIVQMTMRSFPHAVKSYICWKLKRQAEFFKYKLRHNITFSIYHRRKNSKYSRCYIVMWDFLFVKKQACLMGTFLQIRNTPKAFNSDCHSVEFMNIYISPFLCHSTIATYHALNESDLCKSGRVLLTKAANTGYFSTLDRHSMCCLAFFS